LSRFAEVCSKLCLIRKMLMKPAFIRFLFLCSVIFATLAMSAQVVTGTPAFGTFKSFGPTVLDVANLNSRVTIPIMSKPGRGTPFNYAMAYDNSVWVPSGDPGSQSWQPQSDFGWHGISEAVTGYLSYSVASHQCPPSPEPNPHGHETVFIGFVYYDTLGVPHHFLARAVTNSECDDPDHDLLNVPASDGSGYSLTFQPNSGGSTEISAVNGVVIHPPENNPGGSGSVTDVNGNVISTNMTSGVGTFTDTLGTTALAVSGVAPDPVSLTYTDSNGVSQSVTLNYQAFSVRTNFGCSQIAEYSATNKPLLTSIVFPDQSSYTFTYESTPGDAAGVTGRITSITLPTGATINYAYTGGSNGIVCEDGSAAGINVTTSDGGTWQYSRSGSGSQWTATLTDPAGNQTLYSFSGIFQTQMQAYSGAATGAAVFSMSTCYNVDTPSGCVQGEVVPPILEKADQIRLDNAQTGLTKTFYNNSGLPTEVDQYHYGSGQTGPLARRTVINYASLGNRIFDRQSDVTVFDINGNQVATTTFSYDDTVLTATSGLPQHVPVTGSRGNLTHRSDWLNTSNSFLTTTYNYFDTGMLQSVSDPGSHDATFSYDSGGAYVSQVSLPDTSSPGPAHHVVSAGYDAHTGLMTSGIDENGNLTTFSYDSLLRPTRTNLPDGGQTIISYPDPRHVITRQTLMDPFATFSQVELDSYGRVSRMVVANAETAPFDFDTQDSCYDSMGRLVFQSYPRQDSGLATAKVCSGAGDIYSFDGLGRILSLTHSDGSSVQYRYAGRATQITDEGNAVSRILQSDALGRLTQVCEVSNSTLTGSGGVPTSCGLDIAATGFLTSYSYDTLDNLTTVTQGSVTNRSYSYDSLSRMISETEPEWGSSTSYAYDNDGLRVQRVRPAPNQADPNVRVTTTYTYDALHRPLSISYDDGKTDGSHFNYDERSVGVATLNNSIGRMTSATSSSAGIINSFDSIGRIVTAWQRTPSVATPLQMDYRYDPAGNLIASTGVAGATFNYSYNTAGRLTGMLGSPGDANHPPQLLSNVHYGVFGMVSAALGNGVQESAGFTPRGLLESYVAVPPPNAHNYEGFLDHAGCDNIFGWAADRNSLNTAITVTIYDNGMALSTVLANSFRPDVGAFLGDNGLHGFGIPTPESMQDGATHQVSVKFGNGAELGTSPKSLVCPPASTSTVTLTSSGSSIYGQNVGFTARVSVTGGNSVPTGSVTFKDGNQSLGTVQLDSSAQAFLSTSFLSAGTHAITASYSGDSVFPAGFAQSPQVVTPAALSATAASASRLYGAANPVFTGTLSGLQNNDNITVSFQSAATPASPVGTYVINLVLSDPGGKLGNYTVTLLNGTLSVTPAPLVVSVNSASRVYGAPNPALTGTISGLKNNDNIMPNFTTSATAGSNVGTYPIVPTFSDPGGKLGNYNVVIQNGVLNVTPAPLQVTANNKTRLFGNPNPVLDGMITGLLNFDNIQAQYSTTASAQSLVGNYPIVPALSDPSSRLGNYTVKLQNGTLSVTPSNVPLPSPSFSPPAGTYAPGQPVTITDPISANVIHYTTNGTTPTASSPLYTGPIILNTTTNLQAIATLTGYVDSSVTVANYIIQIPVSVSPASQTVLSCGSASYTVSVPAMNGVSGSLAVSVNGLPAGATASFSPASIGSPGSSTLTVFTSPSTPVATYPLTITVTGATSSGATTVTLVVQDFTLAATPSSQTMAAPGTAVYPVSTSALNGFGGNVGLSVSGLPANSSVTFYPPSISAAGSSNLVLNATSLTPVGTYMLTVSGSSGCLTHTQPLTVVVNALPPGPGIVSLDPSTGGPVGSKLIIKGVNFGDTQGNSTVMVNGTVAPQITNWRANSITTRVPPGATSGLVVVTVGGQVSNGVTFTVQ
jgi:YD repeat-containing protein